ncbi:alkanesulfonate monooxygenase SsuD/methylene tetrahydromethanopterin reductase-like flavin-dependent oxidoreductase (luciferase family) [Kitasatospora sp. MAA4]|uniref:LLM class flavin-dependent oxidoreductase n=1 Tax=Kitasatospora sp. MAA4 TaxID=3035093 RepID=UPI0024764A1F|nr:LLM class flavin-dependent oxidoreductase [Kitasatospora sp. MAA4]MDH6133509.1 alkanesulfonate monooxygenase SsuD/methylene tetrahydromethanopterin reductase-like flavin-dependent oxidoreductase (luciferase family) [Kitasatospora sp. MAA4]
MRFIVSSLLSNGPDPVTGRQYSAAEKYRNVVDQAVTAEEFGYDGYGVGERHGEPFLSPSPAVLLAAIAARTSAIRLFTTVTVLSILDPVRVAEDYAMLDQLSGGRLELIIGKGNDPRHFALFGLEEEQQWSHLAENYGLLHRLWREEKVTWAGTTRPPLTGVTTHPRPLQQPVPVWHGSATSEQSTDLAARYGDPLFSANSFHPLEKYRALVDHYRERWAHYGRAPEDARVGTGFGGLFVAKRSQDAVEGFRPYWNALFASAAGRHNNSPFSSLEDALERGSALVGSPQQVIDKIHRYHEAFGNEVVGIGVDSLTEELQREQLALFAAEVAPVIRREL